MGGTLKGLGEDIQEVAVSLGAAEENRYPCSSGGFVITFFFKRTPKMQSTSFGKTLVQF